MDEEEVISATNFRTWKKDPVTIAVMGYIERLKKWAEEDKANPSIVLADRGLSLYASAVGVIHLANTILHLEPDDIIPDLTDEEVN